MFGVGVRRPKNATLLGGPDYKCYIKSKPFKVVYDEAIFAKWLTGKKGHTALLIWDALSTTKSREGTNSGRFPGWTSRSKSDRTLWGSSRRGCWSLSDLDVFRMTDMVALLRRCIKNRPKRACRSRSGGSTSLSTKLRDPSCILINRAMLQQCSGIQCPLDWNTIVDEIGVKNLKAYGDSKLIVNQVRGEYEVRHEDLVPYFNATISMAKKFGNFYITMYHASKMRTQMHWHLSLPP